LEQFVKAKMIEHAPSPLYTNWGNMVATVVSFPKRMKELQPTSSIVNRTLSSLIVLTKLTSTTFIRWLIKRDLPLLGQWCVNRWSHWPNLKIMLILTWRRYGWSIFAFLEFICTTSP